MPVPMVGDGYLSAIGIEVLHQRIDRKFDVRIFSRGVSQQRDQIRAMDVIIGKAIALAEPGTERNVQDCFADLPIPRLAGLGLIWTPAAISPHSGASSGTWISNPCTAKQSAAARPPMPPAATNTGRAIASG